MQDLNYFNQLKSALLKQYKEEHPHFQGSLTDFKGQEIANLQAMLMEKAQGRISEKWFYTHLKISENKKLPRLDMLDLLARFSGYLHWDDFKKSQQIQLSGTIPSPSEPLATQEKNRREPKQNAPWYLLGLLVFLGLGFTIITLLPTNKQHQIEFCFVNDFSLEKIKDSDLKVSWIKQGETPQKLKLNEHGCIRVFTEVDSIVLSIEGAYFQNQTIRRKTSIDHQETIMMQPDTYSMLIDYFVSADVAAWKEKRSQLETLFAPNAMIIHLAPDGKTGMELYNKQEFINKLTMPLKTMKNIKIVDQKRNPDQQIVSLKFMQK